MSNLQSKLSGVRFEPVPAREPPRRPSQWLLVFGVAFPAVVIAIELASRMCAEAFFDPMPTYGHVAAASLVPAGNLLVWSSLRDGAPLGVKWLAFANGVAMAIAGCYALLFLPLLPISILALVVVIGVLPMAPLVSFLCTLRLRFALRESRHGPHILPFSPRRAGCRLCGVARAGRPVGRDPARHPMGREQRSVGARARADAAANARRRRSAAASLLRRCRPAQRTA